MNVCVFGASSERLDKVYLTAGLDLGRRLAIAGHTILFGGGSTGLMGAVADGAISAGGKAIGIAPKFFDINEVLHQDCAEMIFTDTLGERKTRMEEMADAFVVAPGGLGTFDELFEVLTLKQLGMHEKPIAILNTEGYFDDVKRLLETAEKRRFLKRDPEELCYFAGEPEELVFELGRDVKPAVRP